MLIREQDRGRLLTKLGINRDKTEAQLTYRSSFSLTSREHEIVELSALGFSAKEIAQQLVIAPRTVERHLENCRLKLHARNRTHLIAICLTGGMLHMNMARMEHLVSL